MKKQPKYTSIPIGAVQALAGHEDADFAVFLPGSDEQEPVLYHGAGSDLSNPDYERLSDNGLASLLIRSTDLNKCESIIEDRLAEVLENTSISISEKTDLIFHVGTKIARDMTSVDDPAQSIDRVSNVIDSVISFVLSDPDVARNMLYMAGHERSTASHMFVVSTLAVVLGAEIHGSDSKLLKDLGLAGMMHDIGKLKISLDILNKPTPLTATEMLLVQQHPIESVRLLGNDEQISPMVRQMILQHHERIDGRGYPLGLTGKDLHRNSRLLSIVDSFHAMIGRRNYRKPLSPPEAIRAMNPLAGKQFDPEILAVWTALFHRYWIAGIDFELKHNPDVANEDESFRHEHRPTPPPPITFNQRPKRFECKSNVTVECIYSGKLMKVNTAPDKFIASVYNISRAGLNIYCIHPMYRGEVIHVRINDGKNEFWVRGSVAWCKPHDLNMYRVGIQFLERISDQEAHDKVSVRSLTEYNEGLEAELSQRTNSKKSENKSKKRKNKTASKSETPLDRLKRIHKLKSISIADERIVITLSSSSDIKVRETAIDVLMSMGNKPARATIKELLSDDEPIIREKAVIAAGLLEMVEAEHIIRKLLRDPSKTISLRAAGALGKLGDNIGKKIVLDYLKCDGPLTRLAAKIYGDLVGHRFSANEDGVKAARRYASIKKRPSKRKKKKIKST